MKKLSKNLEKKLQDGIHNVFLQHGYTKEEDGFCYYNAQLYSDAYVTTHYSMNNGFFYKMEAVSKKIYLIEEIWSDMKPIINIKDSKFAPSLSFSSFSPEAGIISQSFYDPIFNGIKCPVSDEGVEEYLAIIQPLIENYFLPTSKKFNDLREINKIAMANFQWQERVQGFLGTEGVEFRRLIISKLVDDPKFEELYEFEMSFEQDYIKIAKETPSVAYLANYPVVLKEIYNRLKKIKPLENPILT